MENGGQQVKLFSNTPIYIAAKNLTVHVLQVTQNFERAYKYTVGSEMHRAAISVMRYLAAAIVTKDTDRRLRAIEDYQANFELLKGLIEISLEKKWISLGAYSSMLPTIESLGRQGSAWKIRIVKSGWQNHQGQG